MGFFKPSTTRGGIKAEDWTKKTGLPMESFTAELPQLTQGVTDFLRGSIQSPNDLMRGMFGTQQRYAERGINELLSGQIGSDIVPAIQATSGLNLARGASIIQNQGARFSAAAGQQIGDLTQRIGADTNLAVAQAREVAANRRLNELMAAGQLSNQQMGIMAQYLQPLQLAAAELGSGPAMIKEESSTLGNILGFAAQGAAIASTLMGNPAPMPQVQQSAAVNLPNQGQLQFNPPAFSGGGFGSSVPGAYNYSGQPSYAAPGGALSLYGPTFDPFL